MTNMEFYRDRLELISDSNTSVALVDGEPVECRGLSCTKCKFYNHVPCSVNRTRWLMNEHIEKPKLSQAEMAFLKVLDPNCWIAKDADNRDVWIYSSEPYSASDEWRCDGDYSIFILPELFPEVNFDFITWESNRAWSVKELLNLGVE